MKERLEQLLAAKGYTSQRFAEIMGVQPSGISHILAGRNKPRFDFLERLLRRFPDVSADWLLLGKGPMFRDVELSGSDAVKDVTEYLDDRKEVDNDGYLFPDFRQSQSDFAVGQTVDMVGSITEPEELYDEVYDSGYVVDDMPVWTGGESMSAEPPVRDDNRVISHNINNAQYIDKSVVTNITESNDRVVLNTPEDSADSVNKGVVDSGKTGEEVSVEQEADTTKNAVITNVTNDNSEQPKVIKVVLLYDNGTFKSFDNQ
ncbi:MAG: helix-turn-helix domain-containing protein [Rikenellaceae bacterium]|nr:helix-turn-helix domain-containing protein [Rikenellaceae bacterium]